MRTLCMRCGHSWYARSEHKPRYCPACRSVYWDRTRRAESTQTPGPQEDEAIPEPVKEATAAPPEPARKPPKPAQSKPLLCERCQRLRVPSCPACRAAAGLP